MSATSTPPAAARWPAGARGQGERGAALLVALLFLGVIGLAVAMLLAYAETSTRGGVVVRDQGDAVYAAGGAIDAAVLALRADPELGREGGACPDLTFPGPGGEPVVVTCEGQAGSGVPSGDASPDVPPFALVTTATVDSGEDGVVVAGPNAELGVGGPVFSHSTARVEHQTSTMTVEGPLRARGSCDAGRITSDPPPECDIGAADPGAGEVGHLFPLPISEPPPEVAVPACPSGPGRYVALEPGRYTDVAALNALTAGGCSGAVVHLLPGVHLLDFPDGAARWEVDDRNVAVVGGTPAGWTPGTAPPAAGACDRGAPGVTVLLAGESRLFVRAGAVELCAPPTTDRQRVAIQAVDAAPAGDGAGAGTATLRPTGQVAPLPGSGTPFSPGLDAIDGLVNTGNLNGNSASGGVTLTGFDPGAVPAGAALGDVRLRVAHREVANPQNPPPIASIVAEVRGAGTSCTLALSPRATLGTDEVAVPCLTESAQLDGLTVEWRVTLRHNRNPSAQLDLDGIELDVDWAETGGLRPQSGCVTEIGGCPTIEVLSLGLANRPSFLVEGTVVVPRGHVRLDFRNNTVARLARGLVARSLLVRGIPPADLIGAVAIDLPASGRTDRLVELVATIDGRVRARAEVRFDDAGGADPDRAGRHVELRSYTVDP